MNTLIACWAAVMSAYAVWKVHNIKTTSSEDEMENLMEEYECRVHKEQAALERERQKELDKEEKREKKKAVRKSDKANTVSSPATPKSKKATKAKSAKVAK